MEDHVYLFDYSGIGVSPCDPNPCLYGGTCYRNGNAFVCACQSGWTGTRCEYSQGVIVTTPSTTPSGMLFVLFIYESFDNISLKVQKCFVLIEIEILFSSKKTIPYK